MVMEATEAFVMFGPGHGAVQRWPIPAGELTIETVACGLCQREFGVWSGRIPRRFPDVLGHEVVGRVVDGPLPVGTPVAGMGIQALAKHVRVPLWQVAPVPEADVRYALVEPLACAVNAVEQDPSPADSSVVVFGLGLLGQFIATLLAERGRSVLAVDADAQRRDLAERTGASVAGPGSAGLDAAVASAGVAFECTADEGVLWRLSTGLSPGAALVLVAHHQGTELSAGELLDRWHTRGIAVRNAVPRTSADMASCVRAAARSALDLSAFPVVHGSLAQLPALLAAWPRGRTLRHIVTMV